MRVVQSGKWNYERGSKRSKMTLLGLKMGFLSVYPLSKFNFLARTTLDIICWKIRIWMIYWIKIKQLIFCLVNMFCELSFFLEILIGIDVVSVSFDHSVLNCVGLFACQFSSTKNLVRRSCVLHAIKATVRFIPMYILNDWDYITWVIFHQGVKYFIRVILHT